MKPRHHAKPEMTVAQSTLQLQNLLIGCSDNALAAMDADYLSRCYKVKPMVAMQMLREQREHRRVRDGKAAFDDMEAPLKPVARFPIEPKDKLTDDEATRQSNFRALLRYVGPSITSWAVPNAGKRGFKAQAQVKKEGLTAGVFDEHYAWNHGIAFLEWKDGKGVMSDTQIDWGNAMIDRGFRVACVRTPAFALALFAEWGAPVRGVR